jgi:hypothetical protein
MLCFLIPICTGYPCHFAASLTLTGLQAHTTLHKAHLQAERSVLARNFCDCQWELPERKAQNENALLEKFFDHPT